MAANTPNNANSQTTKDGQAMFFSPQSAKEMDTGAEKSSSPSKGPLSVLIKDSGKNFSEMNFTLFSAVGAFGGAGLGIGEAVKFTAPRPGWNLRGLQIVGWSGFNNTTKTFPPDRNFLIEIRDNDTNLLYKFADTQNLYFASSAGPVIFGMDIPALTVTGDFYVIFYDRGLMYLGVEPRNGTGNSLFASNGMLLPAEFKTEKNESIKVNWLIRAFGD